MKDSEKKGILILIIVSIIIIGIVFTIRNNRNKKQEIPEENTTNNSQYVQTSKDGIKQGTSSKLNETKTIGDIEVSDIQIVEQNGLATITAVVKNNSGTTKKEFPMTLKLLNEKGETIQEVGAYVGTIKSGETRGINASVNMDISQIYDISIEM